MHFLGFIFMLPLVSGVDVDSPHNHGAQHRKKLRPANGNVSVAKAHHKKLRPKVHAEEASDGDLLKFLGDDCKLMQLKEFLPLCIRHASDLTKVIDWNYGDAQLATNLQNFCINSKEFPETHGITGYKGSPDHACQQFVDDLEAARFHELKNGNTDGYKKFCTSFYEHHGGREPVGQKKKEVFNPNAPYKWRDGAFSASVGFAGSIALLALAL